MTARRIHFASLIAAVLIGMTGCATPVAPTGGPPDTTPPFLVDSDPEPNTVNFVSDRITLGFSEKVDRATLPRALSFTPEMVLLPEIQWHGERVDLIFRGPLEDSTTYIMTLDKELRDNRGVALDRPITLAFSTGPLIDEGLIRGRVVDASNGAGLEGLEVFAFRAEEQALVLGKPDYRTQTGTDGAFEFRNLPDRRFMVAAVEDRNRNRLIDSTEAVALPWWGAQDPDSSGVGPAPSEPVPTWLFHRHDDSPPSVVQLRPVSSRRVGLRFSEPVGVLNLVPEDWALVDTASGAEYVALDVYQHYGRLNEVVLLTDSLPESVYSVLRSGSVVDTAGNEASAAGPAYFRSSSGADTLTLRFEGFGPTGRAPVSREQGEAVTELGPEMAPELRFNQSVTEPQLAAIVNVSKSGTLTETDSLSGAATIRFRSSTKTSWTVTIDPRPLPGDTFTVSVALPSVADTVYQSRYVFPDEANAGSVIGVVDDQSGSPTMLLLTASDLVGVRLAAQADSVGRFRFEGLIKGGYSLKAFRDADGDGRWTGGSAAPLVFPEALLWHGSAIEVRKGWETGLDTLRFVEP